eukprot:PITA_05252
MIDDEYTSRFLELLRYVPYVTGEKVNIHRFISRLPVAFKDKIDFDEPRSLEEAIHKLRHCYEKSEHRSETKLDWRALDNKREYYQTSIIEINGKLCDQVISILIDLGSSYSYVSPHLVDKCGLSKELHAKSWLMQLDTDTNKRVHHWVRACAFYLNGMPTATHLNVFPLGLYNMFLGMDWLYLHRTKVDFYDKSIECVDGNGEPRVLQGKKKATSVRMVTTMQAKHSCMKGCMLFLVHISSDKSKEVEDADVLSRYPVLQQFKDVFPKDILEFPPHREVHLSIELVPREIPTSKAPYKMSTPELVELKLQLKEMLDKGYIRPSVSPWGERYFL